MRIIRFLGEDGRVHHGEEHGDGSATVLLDPMGVFGTPDPELRQELFRGRHALIADDDENMRRMMAAVLTKVGCQCTVAADGAEAIDAIRNEPLDLVVSDIIMPHHNGYEIFAAARQRRENIPILLVTGFGYDPSHTLLRASREGLVAVLYKPFTPQQLLDELDKAIHAALRCSADALLRSDQRLMVRSVLAPLEPRAIVCVGPEYGGGEAPAQAAAAGDLDVFLRSSTAVTCSGRAIPVPNPTDDEPPLECHGELAIIIGATTRDLGEEEIRRSVLGYTAAFDVAARRGRPGRESAKGDPGEGPIPPCSLGPALITCAEIDAPDQLGIRTTINDRPVRDGSTADLGRGIGAFISNLSRQMTLLPATVILVGPRAAGAAPAGPASLKPGDEVAVEIDGIGRLVNRLVAT
jgi:2-keto-4-pentenoate hydratase/2-oxohepta-3-ene-1,7-dioic acid hydratase in catechol pathway